MKPLQFAVDVKAPRERVWAVLWDDASYRDWTSAFAEGSYAVSDWKEGSAIQFLDPGGNGMSAIIEKKRPNEFMSFRHVAEIRNGQEQPPSGGAGAHEDYTLSESGGTTRLTVDLEAPDEYREMFERMFPQALQRVKALAER